MSDPLAMQTMTSDAYLNSQNNDSHRSSTTTAPHPSASVSDAQTRTEPKETSRDLVDLEKGSTELNKEYYESLVRRFTMQVTLSTFACALIVTYCNLINALVTNINKDLIGGIAFNIGLLLSFISIALHAGSAIVAGRAAVVCSEPDLKSQTYRDEHYFNNIFTTCEHLDLDGTIVFFAAVFETSFLMFNNYVYPGVFCGVSVLILVGITVGKYRKISVVWKDFRWFVDWFRNEKRRFADWFRDNKMRRWRAHTLLRLGDCRFA
ncbi:hypothetical protein F5887DRAFT_1077572 [Amanita rubescens]|nr:hypothetical protein F5887DRAFT_1077572 [Amanita rubescens]